MSNTTVFMYWDSQTQGEIECWENQEKTSPMDLRNKDLLLIGKKRVSDTDEDAIFSLVLDDGLTLDNQSPYNKVTFIIPAAGTVGLPRTKNTTIWLELLANPDELDRQTIDQFSLPVRPSIKEAYEQPS